MILSTDPKIKRPTIYISELAEEIKPALRPLRITRLSCVSIHQEKHIFRNSYLPQKNNFCQTSNRWYFLGVQLSPPPTLCSIKGYSRSFLILKQLRVKTAKVQKCKITADSIPPSPHLPNCTTFAGKFFWLICLAIRCIPRARLLTSKWFNFWVFQRRQPPLLPTPTPPCQELVNSDGNKVVLGTHWNTHWIF